MSIRETYHAWMLPKIRFVEMETSNRQICILNPLLHPLCYE